MTEQTTEGLMPKVALWAGVAGLVAFLGLMFVADYSVGASLILAVLVTAIAAVLLWIGWMPGEPPAAVVESAAREAEEDGYGAGAAAGRVAPEAERDDPPAQPAPMPDASPAAAVGLKSGGDPVTNVAAAPEVPPVPAAKTARGETPEHSAADAPSDATPATPAEGQGSKPALMDAPREGGADDLKRIRGVGPKLEGELNRIGVYHFDQIAAWSPEEVAWMDNNLVGFRGRVSRDDWVGQAKTLAAGGETDFSSRVKKGDVY